VKPKLGVVYHYRDEEGLWDAIRKEYKGPLVIAKDLMAIDINEQSLGGEDFRRRCDRRR
jgi:hypothetical protein